MHSAKSYNLASYGSLKTEPANNEFADFAKQSDVEIWQDFRNGNIEVLIYIYHKYVSQLLRFGLQFAPRELVKDSIQDLFLYLKERKKHPDEVKNISAYLYKCLYRNIKKKVDYSMNLSSFEHDDDIKNWRIVISKEVKLIEQEDKQEQQETLQRLLNTLSTKQRQALLLYYYEGFTHQEITEIMELKNKSSVRKLIYRGIDMLREAFSA